MDPKDVKTFGEKLDIIIDKIKGFSRLATVDQILKDKDGNEFKLEKESGAPAVGDKASPDGSYTMEDGKTITVADGVVKEITEPADDKTELELANERIAELEAKITNAENAKTEAEAAKKAAEDKAAEDIVKAQALVTELTNLKNTWKPEGRQKNFSNVDKVGDVDLGKAKEYKDKINPKNK